MYFLRRQPDLKKALLCWEWVETSDMVEQSVCYLEEMHDCWYVCDGCASECVKEIDR
jgi:hypothetical protein